MRKAWKIQMGLGMVWLVLAFTWAALTAWQMIDGEEYHFSLILSVVCSGLSAQMFNHATMLTQTERRCDHA